MSIKLEINENIINSKENDLKLHYLPATIDGNGPANVDKYFNSYTVEEDGVLVNALRGYPIKGCKFEVPEGYKGIVFQETQKPLDENADRTFKAAGKFNSFTYWNYDKIPTKNDPLRQAMDVLYIADVLTQPISEEDIKKEMEENKSRLSSDRK